MKHWEYLFEDKILTRGYYYTDFVKITEKSENKVKAIVSGTRDYKTEITFDNGMIDEMYCSCPYFGIDNCKHLAALLFCLEDEEDVAVEYENIEKLVNAVSDEDLKEFLIKELEDGSSLLNRFKLKFSNEINPSYYKSKLSEISFEDDNRHSIDKFISDDLNFLIDKKEYKLVLELVERLFPEIKRWWNYWEDYGDNTDMDELKCVLEKLVYTEVRDELFEWLSDLINEFPGDYHLEELTDLYFENFLDYDELKFKKDFVIKLFKKTSDIQWINRKTTLMRDLKCSDEEIKKFLREYDFDESVMQKLIDMSEGVDKEKLLKRAVKQFEYNEKFRVQLKNYYHDCDKDNYLKELEKLVFDYKNIEYYKEFKKVYSGDWTLKRQEIFDYYGNNNLNEYYELEGLNDLLIANINQIYDLDRYRNVLMDEYSEELLEKYAEVVYSMAQKSGPPKHYEKIAETLKVMCEIPGGEEKVEGIASHFREKYKRRPRMMQALRKYGF